MKTLKEQATELLDQMQIDTGEGARAVLSWSSRFDALSDDDRTSIIEHFDQKSQLTEPCCIVCGRREHTGTEDHGLITDDTLEN